MHFSVYLQLLALSVTLIITIYQLNHVQFSGLLSSFVFIDLFMIIFNYYFERNVETLLLFFQSVLNNAMKSNLLNTCVIDDGSDGKEQETPDISTRVSDRCALRCKIR